MSEVDGLEVFPETDTEDHVAAKSQILYKKAANGKIRMWEGRVKVEDGKAYLETRSGYADGAITPSDRVIKPTKTLTATENATSKLRTAVTKKLSSGYFLTKEGAETYEPSKPMLVHKWDANKDKIEFPAFIQPKLDGVCAIYRDDRDNPRFESRENNEFVKLRPLAKRIYEYLTDKKDTRVLMNIHGEIYAHGYRVSEIVEALKGDNAEVFDQLKFYAFDYIPQQTNYDEVDYHARLREGGLASDWADPKLPFTPIQTLIAQDEGQVEAHYKAFIGQGFEGAIICNVRGRYKYETRSYDKLKYKELFSEEFEIIGTLTEQIGDDDMILFQLQTKDGVSFKARPAWSHDRRKKAMANAKDFIGKKATVEYRSLTKYQTPFHGVLVEVRDYE